MQGNVKCMRSIQESQWSLSSLDHFLQRRCWWGTSWGCLQIWDQPNKASSHWSKPRRHNQTHVHQHFQESEHKTLCRRCWQILEPSSWNGCWCSNHWQRRLRVLLGLCSCKARNEYPNSLHSDLWFYWNISSLDRESDLQTLLHLLQRFWSHQGTFSHQICSQTCCSCRRKRRKRPRATTTPHRFWVEGSFSLLHLILFCEYNVTLAICHKLFSSIKLSL